MKTLLFFLLSTTTLYSFAQVPKLKEEFGKVIDWRHSQYISQAPMPFGQVILSVQYDSSGNVTGITIKTDIGQKTLPKSLIQNMSKVQVPELSFKNSVYLRLGQIQQLNVDIEYGEHVYVPKLKSAHRNFIGIVLDADMKIVTKDKTEFSKGIWLNPM